MQTNNDTLENDCAKRNHECKNRTQWKMRNSNFKLLAARFTVFFFLYTVLCVDVCARAFKMKIQNQNYIEQQTSGMKTTQTVLFMACISSVPSIMFWDLSFVVAKELLETEWAFLLEKCFYSLSLILPSMGRSVCSFYFISFRVVCRLFAILIAFCNHSRFFLLSVSTNLNFI